MRKLGALVASVVLLSFGAASVAPAATAAATAALTYPERGRGAWSGSGAGGTLSPDGLLPGRYFRAAEGDLRGPGYAAYLAIRDGDAVGINDYAVHRAVMAVQTELNDRGIPSSDGRPLLVDGLWGPKVDSAVREFQEREGLKADGVFGPVTSRALFGRLVERAAAQVDSRHRDDLARVMLGTVTSESGWDPAAVGALTPEDLGLGQINGPAHPSMSVDERLDPKKSLPYVAKLIDSNLEAFDYRIDEGIAAYNLGKGGARSWVRAGKPQYWPAGTRNDVHRYIEKILEAGE